MADVIWSVFYYFFGILFESIFWVFRNAFLLLHVIQRDLCGCILFVGEEINTKKSAMADFLVRVSLLRCLHVVVCSWRPNIFVPKKQRKNNNDEANDNMC